MGDRYASGVMVYHVSHQVLQMAPGLTGLEVVPFKVAAYNKTLGCMDFFDPEHREDFEFISGRKSLACLLTPVNECLPFVLCSPTSVVGKLKVESP